MQYSKIYTDEKAPAVALLYCFIKQFDSDCLLLDPQLVRNEVEQENHLILSDFQSDKLNAAIEVLTSDLFENNWNVFESCCHLLANVPVDTSIVSPLSVEELVVGIAEAYLIKHATLDYSPYVRLYAGKIFHGYGFSQAPHLFPDAIMHYSVEANDEEKNKALKELFDFHVTSALDYMEKMQA